MIILPAIHLYDGRVVRLYKGDYDDMTIYDDNPAKMAMKMKREGISWLHVVDIEGASRGTVPNLSYIYEIVEKTGLNVEVGGGMRNMSVIDTCMKMGVSRVILGTAAVNDEKFLIEAVSKYNEKIAVGADVWDGYMAVKGWKEKTDIRLDDFMEKMENLGVKTVICTDISKDGALSGTNMDMYKHLTDKFSKHGMKIMASGGITSLEDIKGLKQLGVEGVILGKSYYTGIIRLKDAIKEARSF